MSAPRPALQVQDLVVAHGRRAAPVLHGISLAVPPGEVLTVVGPSGSGKSTLLRAVCGLLPPRAGRVLLRGEDVTRVAPERRSVAMVFQGFALVPHLDVADNIAFGLAVRRVPRSQRAVRVAEASEALGLGPLLGRLPHELSGGERQRVALARALVRDPALFLLDEPLSALDPPLRAEARVLLRAVLRAEGRAAVLVTHDQGEALSLGDRVVVLRDGVVEQQGTPREVYEEPASPFVAGFLGAPGCSLLPGVDGAAGPLRTEGSGPGTLGVRPEDVRLAPDPAGHVVTAVEDHGHEVHVRVATSAGEVLARLPVRDAPQVGARVAVSAVRTRWWPAP